MVSTTSGLKEGTPDPSFFSWLDVVLSSDFVYTRLFVLHKVLHWVRETEDLVRQGLRVVLGTRRVIEKELKPL